MRFFIFCCFSLVQCFPVPAIPEISADIDFNHQSDQLRRCISETTAHFIQDVVAEGGLPTDRLQLSASQIQQLCIASQTSYQISESTTSALIIEFVSPITTSTKSTNGIDSVIDLLQQLETFKNMLNPEK
jgi:hypothetical protein